MYTELIMKEKKQQIVIFQNSFVFYYLCRLINHTWHFNGFRAKTGVFLSRDLMKSVLFEYRNSFILTKHIQTEIGCFTVNYISV
jgi:hypothetical protein